MGSVLNWFIGSAIFLVVVLVFSATLGQDIGLSGSEVDVAQFTNESGEVSIGSKIGFFTGLSISFSEAPVLISALLIFPTVILLITGVLLLRGVN